MPEFSKIVAKKNLDIHVAETPFFLKQMNLIDFDSAKALGILMEFESFD